MELLLRILAIVLAALLVLVILLQVRGSNFNPLESSGGGFRSRRGFELLLFRSTIVLSLFFVVVSVLLIRFG